MKFDFKKEKDFKKGDVLIINERDKKTGNYKTEPYLIVENNINNSGAFMRYDLINLNTNTVTFEKLTPENIYEIMEAKAVLVKHIPAEKLILKEMK